MRRCFVALAVAFAVASTVALTVGCGAADVPSITATEWRVETPTQLVPVAMPDGGIDLVARPLGTFDEPVDASRRAGVGWYVAEPRGPDPARRRRAIRGGARPPRGRANERRAGADGMLYVGVGDGGNPPGDAPGHAQDLGSLHGKILRIDPRRQADGRPYGIPSDNPFVATPGAKAEVFAYGLRNPWRFSFDPATVAELALAVTSGGVTRSR